MARASAVKTDSGSPTRGREVAGIVLLGLALFVGLSVISLQLGRSALMGPCGAWVGTGLYALAGLGAYAITWGLGVAAMRCLQGRGLSARSVALWAAVGGTWALAVLLHLALASYRLKGYAPGGLIGEYSAELMASLVGKVGCALIAATALSVALVLATPISVSRIGAHLGGGIGFALKRAGSFAVQAVTAIFPERDELSDEDEDEDDGDEDHEDEDPEEEARRVAKARARRRDTVADPTVEVQEHDVTDEKLLAPPPTPLKKGVRGKEKDKERAEEAPRLVASAAPPLVRGARAAVAEEASESAVTLDEDAPSADGEAQAAPEPAPAKAEPAPAPKPRIVELPVAQQQALAAPPGPKVDYIPAKGGYKLPDLGMLEYQAPSDSDLDRQSKDEMLALAEKLQKTLADYGVRGHVQEIHPGPVVTMYEFVPQAGTKLSKISGLANDLAMALAALRVRIVAPIPGKSSVGIEVPNKKRAGVYLKEILVDDGVVRAKSKLTMGLGKDIAGAPVAVDLAKMPHLLVAGTTGSGKSVSVNGMICSILFNATPDEVRMIMIDPKMVELSIYEGIPHLLLPVVTDPKKANLALRWAVEEMERRYELVSKAGVRDLVSYNKKVEKFLAEGPPKVEEKKIKIYVDDGEGGKREVECDASEQAVVGMGGVVTEDVREEISAAHAWKQKQLDLIAAEPQPRKLPYIVVIIDEFADLMMVAPKDVETSVARIAQKARAVGIHLIVATQRPSVDVITGLIKANFPSRIAFQVASKIDARTIMEQPGAENLLGQGDMLFQDRGQALRRVHGALVTDNEIRSLVDHLKQQGQPVYDMDILKPRDEDGEGEMAVGGGGDEGADPVYDQAVRIVCETRNASVSMLQRRLQIGFNRAARVVERMEREGIVGAANGSKPREVLAQAI